MQHETDTPSGYVLTSNHYKYFKTMAYNISVLQSLFLINKLCDPSVHANSLTNSSSNALNSANYEYKLIMVSGLKHMKGNSQGHSWFHHTLNSAMGRYKTYSFPLLVSMSSPRWGQAPSMQPPASLTLVSVQRECGEVAAVGATARSPRLLGRTPVVIPPTKKQT